MKSKRRSHTLSSTTTTTTTSITLTYKNDHPTPTPHPKTTQIPITSPPSSPPIPSVHSAATKIQSIYRTHITKTLYKKISAVHSSANNLQTLIQRQETVDSIRSNDQERLKINEALMGLLLILDSVPGWNPIIREVRRNVSRRIVGLQEIMDAVTGSRVENWDGFLEEWDDVVERMEKDVCEERGGGFEMEKYCAEKLGFRCLERFLRDQ